MQKIQWIKNISRFLLVCASVLACVGSSMCAENGTETESETESVAKMELLGDWKVRVEYAGKTADFDISPAYLTMVTDEKLNALPIFNPNGPDWRKAMPFPGVNAQECAVRYAYLPGSASIKSAKTGEAGCIVFEEGKDYQIYDAWGNVGRLEGGRIAENMPVFVSYQYGKMRIDAVVLTADGTMKVVEGESHVSTPTIPEVKSDEKLIATVWISGRIEKLTEKNLFPLSKVRAYTPMFLAKDAVAKTYGKLVRGERVRILAWGDSVTACGYLPDEDRWQCQFVSRLQKQFPNAEIELIHEGWGGMGSQTYWQAAVGTPKNYQEHVLGVQADLVVLEFVNDAWMNPEMVEKYYAPILKDFQERGIEWILCTPHYVRADWMGLESENGVDDDPRPYTLGLREFGRKHGVAVADAAFYYGQLYRQGIPYSTLMVNNINHPNREGMKLFADALMKLFEEK
ncbi:MAG: GDSL-type esterase/lipase family protein [Planctomycetia bacterium]|nr:GDSL-type esterase/lipase family protein [Planctomycetia bacterium]